MKEGESNRARVGGLLDPEDGATLCGVDLTSLLVLDPSFDLSTQQTADFLANFSDKLYFPKLDAKFEQILTQAETCISPKPDFCCSSVTASTMCTLPSVTMTSTSTFKRVYASPKGREAVQSASPTKTKEQTEWAVKVWKEWAIVRNTRLLSNEHSFSTTFCELTVSEMDFWLSRFVLEVRRKNGDP